MLLGIFSKYILYLENPSCLQTTEASSDVHCRSQTVLQVSKTHTSTRPAFLSSPSTSLTEFSTHTAESMQTSVNGEVSSVINISYVLDCSGLLHRQHEYKMVSCHQDSQRDQVQIQSTEHHQGRLVHFPGHRRH